MTRACVTAWAVVAVVGCGRPEVQPSPTPAKDRAELEARFDRLRPGHTPAQVDAYLGARGAALTGYSTTPVRRVPADVDGAVAAGETDRYWASGDATSAVRVVFADGKARLLELLTLRPMDPLPVPLPAEAPAP